MPAHVVAVAWAKASGLRDAPRTATGAPLSALVASRGPASEPAAVPSIGGLLTAGLSSQAVRPLVPPPPAPATGPHGPVPFGPPTSAPPLYDADAATGP